MSDALARLSEELRQAAANQAHEKHRADRGQFFTPWATARLMASMSTVSRPTIRLLDPGAGTGALTAAWLSEVLGRPHRPERVEVVAYEIDEALLPYLTKMLGACRELCASYNVELKTQIVNDDFLHGGAAALSNLADPSEMRFDAVIMNPPYKKIRSDSQHRAALRSVGIETSNLYTAFLSLVLPMLRPGGELIAITPRSFCNGTYFRSFRREMLKALSLQGIHVFDSRTASFSEDAILQENVILKGIRSWDQDECVIVSSSRSAEATEVTARSVPFFEVVRPNDPESFIHIVPEELGSNLAAQFVALPSSLGALDLSVSTGRVVDFRALEFIVAEHTVDSVPLIYPRHFQDGFINWPQPHAKKPDAILVRPESAQLLVDSGTYVLVKRFSAKEERRRVVAAVFDPADVPGTRVGFENHVNYFHRRGKPLPRTLALGLAAYLNSTALDQFFRQFSGHTQVNATDLRNLKYPRGATLEKLGAEFEAGFPEQEELDRIVQRLAFTTPRTSVESTTELFV